LGAAYPLEYDNVYRRIGRAVIFKIVHEKAGAKAGFCSLPAANYSTVTDFARLRGWSTSVPLISATW
jgi:hypothetical protein